MLRIACFLWLVSGLWVTPARGAIFLLNSTTDASDYAPGDGFCDSSPVVGVTICSLRGAVQEANALAGDDVIQLLDHVYALSAAGLDTTAAAGDLDIKSTIRIEGQGMGVSVIEQGASDRVFELPFLGGGILTLIGVTVRGGDAGDDFGGGIYVREGTLTLDHVEITGNAARLGGGIFNYGTTVAVDSAIHGNHAAWHAGGIASASLSASGFPTTTLMLRSTTIGPNAAELWPSELALSNGGSATLTNVTVSPADTQEMSVEISNENVTLDHVTIRGELTPYSFDGLDTLGITNSAIEYCNLLPSPLPVISRLGVNASANAGCQFAVSGGIEGPLGLGPLHDNSGATRTFLPVPGSPLVDAADDGRCAATDQRGVARPQNGGAGGGCDIGAVEGVPEPGVFGGALAALGVLASLRRAIRSA